MGSQSTSVALTDRHIQTSATPQNPSTIDLKIGKPTASARDELLYLREQSHFVNSNLKINQFYLFTLKKSTTTGN